MGKGIVVFCTKTLMDKPNNLDECSRNSKTLRSYMKLHLMQNTLLLNSSHLAISFKTQQH